MTTETIEIIRAVFGHYTPGASPVTEEVIAHLFAHYPSGHMFRAGIVRGFLRGPYFDAVWSVMSAKDCGRRWEYP